MKSLSTTALLVAQGVCTVAAVGAAAVLAAPEGFGSLTAWAAGLGLAALGTVPLVGLVLRIRGCAVRLGAAAGCVAQGRYDCTFQEDSNCELGRAEAALAEMYATLKRELSFSRGVLSGIQAPFVVVDTQERLVMTNPSLIEILEQNGKPEDHYGQNVAHFFYGDASRRTVLRDSLERGVTTAKEVELIGRRGGKRIIHIHASPLYDLDGALMGALCIYQDLTALRAREAELEAKNERIAEAVRTSEDISQGVATSAEDLATQVREASAAAREQAARAQDAASSMEQMNAAVLDVAKSAADTASRAQETRKQAEEGARVVRDAAEAIAEVSRRAEAVKQDMARLGTQAEGIGRIMDVITDIADQTNLLALNAAIEAARAGDAGRGFAVVADEVRKLAEKTMGATQEVASAIKAIQEGARTSATGMDQAASAVTRAHGLAEASGRALAGIVELAVNTSDQVRTIAAAAEEQSSSSEHISSVVEDVRASAEGAEHDMAAAAQGVQGLAEAARRLNDVICAVGA
jgi:methyl-accepting chemotaxis protein